MIRINLASLKKARSSQAASFDPTESAVTVSDQEIRKQGLIRLLIILAFPTALYAWEAQNIPEKKSHLANAQARLAQLTEKNQKAKSAVEETGKFKIEQKKIQAQINIIESLKKGRMQEVKVLDSIQRMIPSKVWLNKVDLNDGKLMISGQAANDNGLTSFMDALSRSIYFKDVSLVRSTDFLDERVALTVKKFEISCAVEKVL